MPAFQHVTVYVQDIGPKWENAAEHLEGTIDDYDNPTTAQLSGKWSRDPKTYLQKNCKLVDTFGHSAIMRLDSVQGLGLDVKANFAS